mgnify:CR=1 FL=1
MAYQDDQETRKANMDFIRKSMAVPLLSKEREKELAVAWRDDSDELALHELINAYNRLVVSTATKFRNYGLPTGDLIQEGVLGLLHAANRFEPERDVRFSTYASWWIRSSMQDFILRNWSIVRTGTTAAQKSLFFNLRRLRSQIEEQSAEPFGQAGREMIADKLGVNIRDVEEMEGRLTIGDNSLNAPMSEDGDDSWQDRLADERADPENSTQEMMDTSTRRQWIDQALGELNDRERIIIEERHLTDDSITLEALGQRFGVSKERVRQLENRALKKLGGFISSKVANPTDLLQAD